MICQTFSISLGGDNAVKTDRWKEVVEDYLNNPPEGTFVRDTHFSTTVDARDNLIWSFMVVYDDIPST